MIQESQILNKFTNNGNEYYNFRCPSCNKVRSVRVSNIGNKTTCRRCNNWGIETLNQREGLDWCGKCQTWKELKEFSIRKDGLKRHCKKCEKEYYLSIPKEKLRKYANEWMTNNPEKVLFYSAKSRAKKLGINFDLELSDIKIPKICPILKIPILTRGETPKNNSPSIDRIIPEQGYIKGNVIIVSWRANWIKNNATKEEISKLNEFMNTIKSFQEIQNPKIEMLN